MGWRPLACLRNSMTGFLYTGEIAQQSSMQFPINWQSTKHETAELGAAAVNLRLALQLPWCSEPGPVLAGSQCNHYSCRGAVNQDRCSQGQLPWCSEPGPMLAGSQCNHYSCRGAVNQGRCSQGHSATCLAPYLNH